MSQVLDATGRLVELTTLLLEYGRVPGKYAAHLGEPKVLYRQIDVLAQWALGRVPEDVAGQLEAGQQDALAAAAVLFLQRCCFAPGNTHYQVLGLADPSLSAEALRQRYRALIRLTHPDVGVGGLPANAAGMVNRAYEVLSSAPLRKQYDEQLRSAAPAPPGPAQPHAAARAATPATAPPRAWSIPVTPSSGPGKPPTYWTRLCARHPRLARTALFGGVAAVPLLLLVLWTASETTHGSSRMLVVARTAGKKGVAAPPVNPEAAPPATAHPGAHGPRNAEPPAASVLAHMPATDARPAQERAGFAAVAPSEARRGAPPPPQAAAASADSQQNHAFGAAAAAASTASLPAARQPSQAAPLEEAAPIAPIAPAEPMRADTPTAPRLGEAALQPTPVPSARPAPPAVAATETAAAPLTVAATTPAPQAPAALAPVWSVDATAARQYLQDIVTAMQQPAEARRLDGYLGNMKVKGSLLQPIVALQSRSAALQVQRSVWSEDRQPGRLSLRTLLVLSSASGNENPVTYTLAAEFHGTREGTMLERLDLKEER